MMKMSIYSIPNLIVGRTALPKNLLILLCIFCTTLRAQNSQIVAGVVTETVGETNEALPAVTVMVEGTNVYAMTDNNGKYSIAAPDANAVLVFSLMGYKTVKEKVGSRTVVNVTMEFEEAKALEEVVVVGYGTMKKSDLTGAVASIKSEAIQKSVPTSLDQVLQGRAAGVQVQQNSGMPGATTSIRIRGISSLNASTDPIYVIDGAVIEGGSGGNVNTNPLLSINPSDIVSMDILKDASAAAIYGSRAANGVILITTRRGQKGGATVAYNGYAGWQQIPKKLDVLNLREYAAHRNVLADNGMIDYNNHFVRPDLLGEGTDWQNEMFNTAMMHSHNVSIGGGNEANTYSLGAGYSNQDGIATGSGFRRYNLSGNFDAQAKKWLKTGINFSFSNTFQKLTVSDQSLIQVALRTTPDVPVRNADGSFAASDEQFMPTNPVAMALLIDNHNETYGIRGNTYAEITPGGAAEGLKFRSELSLNYNTSNGYRFQPTYRLSQSQFSDMNEGRFTKQYNKYWGWTNTLTYDRTFNDVHKLTALLGGELQKSVWSYLMGLRSGYPANGSTDLTLGDATTAANDGYSGALPFVGIFGRVFYSYDNRYLLTVTLRRDGSTNFAQGRRWGTFPSAALAWRVSEEAFLKDNATINNLKLRLGYGQVGNQNIPDHFSYMMRYGIATTPWGAGLYADNMSNENVTWETTASMNAGIDLSLLKNRVELVFDWYRKKTADLLMYVYVPDYLLYERNLAWGNVGSLQNAGIEITLNTVNVENRNFSWRSSVNFSLNRNKVLNIGGNSSAQILGRVDDNSWGMTGQTVINRSVEGQPVGQFFGYKVIGRFEKATDFYRKNDNGEIVRTPVMSDLPIDKTSGVWIGDYIYSDLNNDGVINEQDRAFIGNPEPKFTYGIGSTFTYKNIDFSFQLTGVYGNDAVNYARRYMENPRRNISNLFSTALDYARIDLIDPNGPDDYRNVRIAGGASRSPRLPLSTATSDYDFAFSDRFIEDGSYLRIQNVSLGYNFPQQWTQKIGVASVKVYVNLQNLYTFTKYRGFDPEIGVSYGYQGSMLTGVDNGRYPSPRIYTFGLNVSF
ncbi:MAG: TonB-dependent receptor [Prevotellaceae bacterium]|jgi:TonB-linked SusC/RagA family outer membrane protein|nr:TonB-dependent receptor [Prevotellaceae bacterium]